MRAVASSPPPRARRRTARAAACLCLALLGAHAGTSVAAPACKADASRERAQAVVRNATDRLLGAVARERDAIVSDPRKIRALVDEHVSPHVDLEGFSRLVLGKHWARATEEQRRRFVSEFRELVLRTYATALTDYTDIDIDYLPLRPESREKLATVRTRVPRPGGPAVSIDYRLHCHASGAWKLFDVRVEGVSMVTTFRSAFSAEVAKSGIDGLIEALAEKNRQKSAEKGT